MLSYRLGSVTDLPGGVKPVFSKRKRHPYVYGEVKYDIHSLSLPRPLKICTQ